MPSYFLKTWYKILASIVRLIFRAKHEHEITFEFPPASCLKIDKLRYNKEFRKVKKSMTAQMKAKTFEKLTQIKWLTQDLKRIPKYSCERTYLTFCFNKKRLSKQLIVEMNNCKKQIRSKIILLSART